MSRWFQRSSTVLLKPAAARLGDDYAVCIREIKANGRHVSNSISVPPISSEPLTGTQGMSRRWHPMIVEKAMYRRSLSALAAILVLASSPLAYAQGGGGGGGGGGGAGGGSAGGASAGSSGGSAGSAGRAGTGTAGVGGAATSPSTTGVAAGTTGPAGTPGSPGTTNSIGPTGTIPGPAPGQQGSSVPPATGQTMPGTPNLQHQAPGQQPPAASSGSRPANRSAQGCAPAVRAPNWPAETTVGGTPKIAEGVPSAPLPNVNNGNGRC